MRTRTHNDDVQDATTTYGVPMRRTDVHQAEEEEKRRRTRWERLHARVHSSEPEVTYVIIILNKVVYAI